MRSKFKWIFTLLLALSMQFSFAQEKTVTGVVSDASGTLPGANVVVQGTTRGTQTDIDGRYSISASVGDVLVFSFVGMADTRVTVGASNVINAKLAEGGLQLSEVVVTGAMGITRSKDAVTSTQQIVRAAELTQAANPNVVQSLVGKVSGLQINTTNVGVNSTTRIVLRGNRSLTGNNQALIVIDNAISSATVLQSLAPEMIESTNVLKGAQGAALYGSDGSNGVIIVTTKRGARGGKPVVSINSAIDFEEVAFIPQRQQRYGQGWSGSHVAYENGAWGAEMDGTIRPVGLAQADGSYIMAPYSPIKDNIKKFFNTGTIMQNGFSVNAGDENGYASFTANKQNTEFVVAGDKLNRSSFLFKGGKTLGKWKVEGIANYVSSTTETTSANLYTELLQAATNIPVDQFTTPLNQHHWTSYYRSPYWMRENIRNDSRREYFSGIATLNYELNKNINFNYTANVQTTQINGLSFTNEYIDLLKVGSGDHSTVSALTQSNSGERYIYGDFLANFNYDLTDKLNLKFNLGNNVQDRLYSRSQVGGTNFTIPGLYTIDNIQTPNITTGNPVERTGNGSFRQRSFAFFANVDLGYDDYLFLNLTARNDWTSILDKSNNNYFYPSAGLSFVPTKAFDALENNDVLNYLKIAASWVRIGNNNVLAYGVNNLYNTGTGYPFGDNNSFAQRSATTDPFIRPEFYTTKEITVNAEFLKSRITLDVSAFRTDNKDLNTEISTSSASGFSSANINVGQTQTNGIEIDLGFTPIDNQEIGLKWTNRLSYYSAVTDVLKISDQADQITIDGANFATSGGIGIFAQEGEEFPLIKGIGYQRDDQGRVIINSSTGMPEKTLDYVILGKATPDYILGYNTAVEFKGFRLAAVMDYRTGHQFWSDTKYWLSWSGHLYDSAVTGRTGFIFPNSSIETSPGVYSPNTSVVTGGTTYSTYLSYFQDEFAETAENFILDATAFKVRELSLSYAFPADMLTRAGLSSLRLGVNARNPFTVLPKENRNYSDPEQSRSSGNDQGIAARGQYPQTRTYGFSVNLTF